MRAWFGRQQRGHLEATAYEMGEKSIHDGSQFSCHAWRERERAPEVSGSGKVLKGSHTFV